MSYRKRQISFRDLIICLLEYLLIFVCITTTACIWTRSVFGVGIYSVSIYLTVGICFVGIVCLLGLVRQIKKTYLIYWLLYLLVAVVISVTSPSGYRGLTFYTLFLPWLSVMLLCFLLRQKDLRLLAKRYVYVVCFFAVSSLILWLLASVLKVLPSTGRVSFDWGRIFSSRSFFNLYYENTSSVWQRIDLFGIEGYKNFGIFTEAPMYAFILSTAYLIGRTYCKLSKWVYVCLLATILSTFNTTAYIAILLYEGILLCVHRLKNKKLNVLKNLLIPVFIIVVIGLLEFLFTSKQQGNSNSMSIRADHLQACIRTFFHYFPFGCGSSNDRAVFQFAIFHQGMSMGLVYLFAQTGLMGILLVSVPFFFFLKDMLKHKKWSEVAFALAFFVVVFTTNVTYNSKIQWFVFSIVFMRYRERLEDKQRGAGVLDSN